MCKATRVCPIRRVSTKEITKDGLKFPSIARAIRAGLTTQTSIELVTVVSSSIATQRIYVLLLRVKVSLVVTRWSVGSMET